MNTNLSPSFSNKDTGRDVQHQEFTNYINWKNQSKHENCLRMVLKIIESKTDGTKY